MKQPLASFAAVALIVGAPAAFVQGASGSGPVPAPAAVAQNATPDATG